MFALYGQKKTLRTFIATLFVAEVVAETVLVALTVPSIEIIPTPLSSTLDANACLFLNVPSLFPNFWYGQNPVEYVDRSYVALDFQVAQRHF